MPRLVIAMSLPSQYSASDRGDRRCSLWAAQKPGHFLRSDTTPPTPQLMLKGIFQPAPFHVHYGYVLTFYPSIPLIPFRTICLPTTASFRSSLPSCRGAFLHLFYIHLLPASLSSPQFSYFAVWQTTLLHSFCKIRKAVDEPRSYPGGASLPCSKLQTCSLSHPSIKANCSLTRQFHLLFSTSTVSWSCETRASRCIQAFG